MENSKLQNSNGGAARRDDSSSYCRALLQDMICFVLLFTMAMLVLWAFFYVMDDMMKVQSQPPKRLGIPLNDTSPMVVGSESPRRCHWPNQWCRLLFNCPKRHAHISPDPMPRAVPLAPDAEPIAPAVKPLTEYLGISS
ncbi:uncharacterized protein LOC115624138 [Scaptodrosophila lebanonensis]|uniref:Uncharacterized protein LOC115624138 n=1 Tax=Drosophila lebanonensis TaxID=7225 RepID=A0A6J2THK7_DROLE|nr:uncharacterized protein LOC115624138 [Scaptodrosophila lebanonensis]